MSAVVARGRPSARSIGQRSRPRSESTVYKIGSSFFVVLADLLVHSVYVNGTSDAGSACDRPLVARNTDSPCFASRGPLACFRENED